MTTAIEIHTVCWSRGGARPRLDEGLAVTPASRADRDQEVEATTRAYVGAAVSEIATLRAELSGPQVG